MRLLIASTLDSKEPFGAFTRPYYLGKYLAEYFEVCQLGLDCSAIDYAEVVSVGKRDLGAYRQAIRSCIAAFQPEIIYAQETLPAIASLSLVGLGGKDQPSLVFDFHTLSAFEYWTRLGLTSNRLQEFKQLIKTYIAQGILLCSGKPIIAASQQVADLASKWYPIKASAIYAAGNGVPDDLLNFAKLSESDPYKHLRPAKVIVVVAPKTFSFPTNDMSVDMTLQIAKRIERRTKQIHFVIVGRNSDGIEHSLPENVTFAGFLPKRKDFLAHLHNADATLLPFSKQAVAGGARNKSLDFLASRRLVISTPEGIRGLEEFQHAKHLLITDYSVESIAATIFDACIDMETYKPLSNAAAALIQAKYSWKAMAKKVAMHLIK